MLIWLSGVLLTLEAIASVPSVFAEFPFDEPHATTLRAIAATSMIDTSFFFIIVPPENYLYVSPLREKTLFIPACNHMTIPPVGQLRHLLTAFFRCILTSCTEWTSGWHFQRTRNIPLQHDSMTFSCCLRIRNRNCGQQTQCIWMYRICI